MANPSTPYQNAFVLPGRHEGESHATDEATNSEPRSRKCCAWACFQMGVGDQTAIGMISRSIFRALAISARRRS
jgi:hypothetical protein